MKLKNQSKILKYIKTELLKIKQKEIIVDLGEYVLENGCMPVPTYSKSKECKHIVRPTTIYIKNR